MNFKRFLSWAFIFLIILFFLYLFTQFTSPELKCNKLTLTEKDICFLKLSKQKNITEFCQKIEGPVVLRACNGMYWNRNDCSYWELMGENDACILSNLERYSVDICNEIQNKSLAFECESFFIEKSLDKNNPSFCANNVACLFQYAIEQKNPTICEELKNIDLSVSALCFTYMKIFFDIPDLCKDDSCFIFDYEKEKQERCTQKQQDYRTKLFCKTIDAIETKNIEICLGPDFTLTNEDENEEVDAQPVCIMPMALKYNNTSYCELIKGEGMMTPLSCKYSITKDPALCRDLILEKKITCSDPCEHLKENSYVFNKCLQLKQTEEFKQKEHTIYLQSILFN